MPLHCIQRAIVNGVKQIFLAGNDTCTTTTLSKHCNEHFKLILPDLGSQYFHRKDFGHSRKNRGRLTFVIWYKDSIGLDNWPGQPFYDIDSSSRPWHWLTNIACLHGEVRTTNPTTKELESLSRLLPVWYFEYSLWTILVSIFFYSIRMCFYKITTLHGPYLWKVYSDIREIKSVHLLVIEPTFWPEILHKPWPSPWSFQGEILK